MRRNPSENRTRKRHRRRHKDNHSDNNQSRSDAQRPSCAQIIYKRIRSRVSVAFVRAFIRGKSPHPGSENNHNQTENSAKRNRFFRIFIFSHRTDGRRKSSTAGRKSRSDETDCNSYRYSDKSIRYRNVGRSA